MDKIEKQIIDNEIERYEKKLWVNNYIQKTLENIEKEKKEKENNG